MRLNLSLSQKGLLVVSVILVLELTFVSLLIGGLHDADAELAREQHAQAVIYHLNRQANMMQRLTIEFIRFVVTQNPKATPHQMMLIDESNREFNILTELLKDEPKQKQAVMRLRETLAYGISTMEQCRKAYFDQNQILHLQLASRLHSVSDQCSAESDKIVDEFISLEKQTRQQHLQLSEKVQSCLILGLIFNVVVCIALAGLFTRYITGRLDVIFQNTIRLAIGKALKERLRGHDELARVDHTFHNMAQELESSRQKERAVIEHLPVGVVTVNNSGRIESINPRMAQMCSHEPEDVVGHDISSLFASQPTQNLFSRIKESGYGRILEMDGMRSNATTYPVELSMTKFQTADGERFLVNVQDISERREIENAKQEFVAMVSHDLRTPLTAISGALALIEAGRIDAGTQEGLMRVKSAQDSVERLINLVNDLLDVEKLASGTLKIEVETVDLGYIIQKSVDAVRGLAEKTAVSIKPAQTTIQILADRDRCVQMLINLLSNAIKFSPVGKTVEVNVQQVGGFAQINVKDEGKGIPEEFQESVFERFKQVTSADGKRGAGTGLGLTICKSIVESHGGSIGLESEVGKGSTFWVRIPLADPDEL